MSIRSVEGEKPEGSHFYRSVELEVLLGDLGKFSYGRTGEGIQTEGFYKVSGREISSQRYGSYGYDGFGASYRSSLFFFVDELGILSSTLDSPSLRVHRYYRLRAEVSSDEIKKEPIGLVKQVVVSGVITRRFQNGYLFEVHGFEEKMH